MKTRPRRTTLVAAGLAFALVAPATVHAQPANTLRELWTELGTCLRTATASDGLDLTIVFSLKRNGQLLGKPKITHAKLPDAPDARQRAADSVARAMQICLPLSITDALGGAIAGQPLAVRIMGRRKDTDT